MGLRRMLKGPVPNPNADLRYEIKLTWDAHGLAQARSWIKLHPAGFVVAYPPRRVNSLYFDTLDLNSLNENLAGVIERQKLRLRWYGNLTTAVDNPVLELKQKRNQLGVKKQRQLPCKLDLALPWSDIIRSIRAHAGADWKTLLQTVQNPTLINSYQREYYVTADGAVRITLDYAQTAFGQRFALRPNLFARLLIPDNVVIEIKTPQDCEDRLHEIACWFPVRRSRNSKYTNSLMASFG